MQTAINPHALRAAEAIAANIPGAKLSAEFAPHYAVVFDRAMHTVYLVNPRLGIERVYQGAYIDEADAKRASDRVIMRAGYRPHDAKWGRE